MRVFVAGATGAVGRQLVPLLLREGHAIVVAHSFAGWPYARVGATIKNEDGPLDDRAGRLRRPIVVPNCAMLD